MNTRTDDLLKMSFASEKAKSLLIDTLTRFQSEGFLQCEVDYFLKLLNQAVNDSNGLNAFRSYLLDET